MNAAPLETEGLWRQWVAERNLRGLRLMSLLVIVLYPVFWFLDWVTIEAGLIWVFAGLRLIGVAFCAVVLVLLRTGWAQQHHHALGVAFVGVVWGTLLVMVWSLGGPTSPYYAGLNLATLGTGILFLFSGRGAIKVYGSTIVAWLIMTALATEPGQQAEAVGNTLFVVSTGIVVVLAQYFFYGAFHEQVLTKISLEKAHNKLMQLDHFKSEVFANITHELKTPLAMVLSPLELILDGNMGPVSEGLRASLQSMYRNAVKLLKMIGDILMLTKLEESRLRLRVEEHNLVDYLDGLVAQIRPLAQRKELSVNFGTQLTTCMAWVDLERIERVFVNLLSNAAKFTPIGGTIDVRLLDEGDSALITVRDSGPGFPADMAERVFDRFFQVDSSATRRQGGTGIGLALSKQLVELHSGEIWAESEEGKGATFFVRLFKAKEHLNPDALDRRQRRAARTDGRREGDRGLGDWSLERAAGDDFRLLDIDEATERRIVERDPDEHQRAHTVLIVEDTHEIIRVVHLSLRQHARVMAAEDGLKGLELAFEHLPDLIVTDLMMPGIDGLELTRRLREDDRTRNTPIVMLTARGELEDRVVGLETGVNAYLSKPFSPKELLTTVLNLLESKEQTADALLSRQMNSLEEVARGLAHEINNPLNYVKNALGLIQRNAEKLQSLRDETAGRELTPAETAKVERLEARINKMFVTAEAGLSRIGGVVETMRSYAREGFERKPRPYNTFEAARSVIDIVVPAIGKEFSLETSFKGDGTIICVAEELHQLLSNLLQNAIEAVEGKTGRVEIRGRRVRDEVMLSVKDNGHGMTREVRERIFTAFYSTKGPGRGMGVGLTIVWRVVQSLGGSIRVESQPGQGAEFIVTLPAAPNGRRDGRDGGLTRAVS